jgi:hypothetical protein
MADSRTTTTRGYGAQHQQERAKWVAIVDAGDTKCARCHALIKADQAWDLDHNDDRTGYIGPSHVSCNRSAGGRNGAAVTNSRWTMTVRDWD